MNLVVDIGNSRVKWAQAGAGRLAPGPPFDRTGPLAAQLDAAWSHLAAPDAVLISSVAGSGVDADLEQWMTARWDRRPAFFESGPETLGIHNAYAEPACLGSDRWAAVIGAREWSAGVVGVIDCGTAVTLDAVDAEDRHLGGWIFPGLELSRRGLLTRTARIRRTTPQSAASLGRSTAECVANGVLLGLVGVLERWMTEAERTLPGIHWIATGGDWLRLAPSLDKTVRHDPDLVLRGLARALRARQRGVLR